MKTHLTDDVVDLTVTSPPYDKLRSYNGFTWNFPEACEQLWRITKPGGIVMWNVCDSVIDGGETGSSMRQELAFMDRGFKLHDTMIYEKGNFSNTSSNRYHQIWEFMFVFSKGKLNTFNPIMDKPISQGEGSFGRNTTRQVDGSMKETKRKQKTNPFGMRTNIWRMKTAGQERPGKAISHPAKMPDAMARDHILSWSNEGDMVFDPFCGSGTTGIEAIKLNRNFIGCEISSEYVKISQEKMQNTLRDIAK